MSRKHTVAAALVVGLLASVAGEALGAVARDDRVRAELVETGNGGFKVVLRFRDLTRNDRVKPPIVDRDVFTTRHSEGIKSVLLTKGGRLGPRRVVIRLTQRLIERVLDDGSASTSFGYLIKDSCDRPGRCGPPLSRASVKLRVVSPN